VLDARPEFVCISLMNKKLLAFISLASLAGAMTGCVNTVSGTRTAGDPFRKDSISGNYMRSAEQVFNDALEILKTEGKPTSENLLNHSLQAIVNQRNVYVKVDELDAAKPLTRITVEVRTKGGGVDLDLAAQLEKEVALKLESQGH
jgi:hypothetical protein